MLDELARRLLVQKCMRGVQGRLLSTDEPEV